MLKLIAPFRALFNLDDALVVSDQPGFARFLEFVQDKLNDPQSSIRKKIDATLDVKVNIPSTPYEEENISRYTSLEKYGSLFSRPNLFTLSFKPSQSEKIKELFHNAMATADRKVAQYSDLFMPDVNSVKVDLHNNTIAILSLELAIDHEAVNKRPLEWNGLDEWTTILVQQFLAEIYPTYIFPPLLALNKLSVEFGERFVRDIVHYNIFMDLVNNPQKPYYNLDYRFKLMWVNRTLCYYNEYPANHWIHSLTEDKDFLHIEKAQVHLHSGNNVIVMPEDMDKTHLEPLWDVVLLAQYYYAAMDVINANLLKYISVTFNKRNNKALYHLSNDIEDIVTSVTILQLRYNDTLMELQGLPFKILDKIRKEWRFDPLLREVQKKIDLCKANIALLNQEKSDRNQKATEIILIGLAGTNLVYLFIAVSSYAIELAPQRKELLGDMPGFLSLGFMFSGNTLSWVGILITLFIMTFVIRARGK